MDIDRFRKKPILGILRTAVEVDMEALTGAAYHAGLEAIEIAMNSKGAPDLIRRAARHGRIMVGAGTVTSMDRLKEALDSGATFIVMPAVVDDVVEYCVKNRIQVFPGALTPQETYNAWQAGATMVKIFPASVFGSAYIRELKAPFDNIELLACGGVTPDNIKDYFASGASAVAFGSGIFKTEWLEKGDYGSIARATKDLIDHA